MKPLVLLGLALLSSCTFGPERVYFIYPANQASTAEALLQSLMLPPGYTRADSQEHATVTVTWEVTLHESPSDRTTADWTISRPLAATVVWTSDAFDLSVPASGAGWLQTYPEPTHQWLGLSEVRLPRRAVSLGSRWPGDPEYPVWQRWTPRSPVPDALVRWWKQAPLPSDFHPTLVWIGAVGDIMPGRGSDRLLLADQGPQNTFTTALPVMQSFDLLLANLETAVTTRGTKHPKSYNFRVPPTLLEPLKTAGIDWVSIANNHSLDWGQEGFTDTLAALQTAQFPFGGGGLTPAEVPRPSVLQARGQEVRVWAAGDFPAEGTGFNGPQHAMVTAERPGIFWLTEATFTTWERAMKAPNSLNVAVIHGGNEWSLTPSTRQQTSYRRLADQGAQLVIAHHPHVLQPLEVRGQSLIVYSLGNFLFNGMEETEHGLDTVLLAVGVFDNQIRSFRFWSARLSGPRVGLDDKKRGGTLLWSLTKRWAAAR